MTSIMYIEEYPTNFDLKTFLKSEYYIGYARATLGDDASEDPIIRLAIKTYQENFRIEATGILDDETLSSMKTPRSRCDVVTEYNSTQNNYDWYRDFVFASDLICRMANRLSLDPTITDGACKIYKMLEDYKCARSDMMDFVVACIYIACRQQGKHLALTMQEISSSVIERSEEYNFVRAKEYIVEQLKVESVEEISMMPAIPARTCEAFVERSCSSLCMRNQLKVVQESMKKAGDLDIRSKPLSVAAAIIYMVTQLSKLNKSLREISIATIVAEDTIKRAYRDVYPHAANIIPEWYATQTDLKNLISPIQDSKKIIKVNNTRI